MKSSRVRLSELVPAPKMIETECARLEAGLELKGSPQFSDEFLEKIGEFWGESFNVGLINMLGKCPSRMSSVISSIDNYAKAFGKNVVEAGKRVSWSKFK